MKELTWKEGHKWRERSEVFGTEMKGSGKSSQPDGDAFLPCDSCM